MEKNRQLTYGLGSLGVLLGGLGVFLMSDRGRELFRGITRQLAAAPESLEQFADATQAELERIQHTLDEIAAGLQTIG